MLNRPLFPFLVNFFVIRLSQSIFGAHDCLFNIFRYNVNGETDAKNPNTPGFVSYVSVGNDILIASLSFSQCVLSIFVSFGLTPSCCFAYFWLLPSTSYFLPLVTLFKLSSIGNPFVMLQLCIFKC